VDNQPSQPTQSGNPAQKTQPKKRRHSQWFKITVSTLLAIVTILGAWVAWRANTASNEAGDNDSLGLLALQNAQGTIAVSYIQGDGHEIGYVDYLRNRTLAKGLLTDGTLTNASPADADRIARTITETLDLANTSRFYFFPDRYLDQNDDYDFNREINEAFAQAEENKDLDYQTHFDTSDALGNKVMGLVSMLVVLAIALWLLALSEVLSSIAKYATALGGLLFMILGGVSAYLIDSDSMLAADVGAFVMPTTYVLLGITFAAALLLLIVGVVRGNKPRQPVPAASPATAPPPSAPTPQYPQQIPPDGQQVLPNRPHSYDPQTGAYIGGQPPQPPPLAQSAPPELTTAEQVQIAREEGAAEQEEKDEPFKRVVTILIATVALIASVVAYLQSDASNQSGEANRNVQQYSLQSLGQSTYGSSEMNYNFNTVAQAWKQLDILAQSADRHGDPAAAKRYRDAQAEIQTQSTIFDPKYYDPNTQVVPNDFAYAADLYQERSINLGERAAVQLDLHNTWDGKANAYIAQLTLLAIALALFGLSLAASSFVRYIFAAAGVVMVLGTVVWTSLVYAQPVHSISTAAIDSYSQGAGQEQAGNYDDAIASFNDSLQQAPGYVSALYERANTYFSQATDAYAAGHDSQKQGNAEDANKSFQTYTDKLRLALADYLAVQKAGKDDSYTGWNLGWTYYLLGDLDKAIEADRHVLDKNPNVVPVRLNLGLALLSQGKYQDAEVEYNTAIARTYDQIQKALDNGKTVSSNFWYYLDASVTDLDNLIDRIDATDYSFTMAPPKDKIADATNTIDESVTVIYRLRDKISAFESLAKTGKMPAGVTPTASITGFTFGATGTNMPVEQTGTTFPSGTKSVKAYYSYSDIQKGQTVSFKIYNNYYRYPAYDYIVDNWPNPESGDRWITVTDPYDAYSEAYDLGAGIWTIEMYVDNNLVQRGFFYIQTYDETQQNATPTPQK
jgi:tetratricopeptide (TPR) repeat protein